MKIIFTIVILCLLAAGAYDIQNKLSQQDQATLPTGPCVYTIVFKDSVTDPAAVSAELAQTHGFTTRFVYEHALKGFSAYLTADQVTTLEPDERIKYIEGSRTVHAFNANSKVLQPSEHCK